MSIAELRQVAPTFNGRRSEIRYWVERKWAEASQRIHFQSHYAFIAQPHAPVSVMNKILYQFGQYILVGGTAFIVDFSTLYLLTEKLGFHYLVSATLGFLLGLAANYALCIAWVFDVRVLRRNWVQEFTVFGLIGIAGLGLNTLILSFLTEVARVHYLASKLVAAAVILLFNFSLRRWALFSEKPSSNIIETQLPPSSSQEIHS